MEIYTAGFTKWSARDFFGALKDVGVQRVVDTRLNNTSQLSGFAKRDDLAYFVAELVGGTYEHEPILAPPPDLLDAYRKKTLPWAQYEVEFLALMKERQIETVLTPDEFSQKSLLLCSEHTPDRCHRRLVVEYLADSWTDVEIVHVT